MPISTAHRPAIAVAVLLAALAAPASFAHGGFSGHGGASGGHCGGFGGQGGGFGGHGGGFGGHSGSFGAHPGGFSGHAGGYAVRGGHAGGIPAATQHFTPRAFSAPGAASYGNYGHASTGHWSAPGTSHAGQVAVASGYGHQGGAHGGYYGHGGYTGHGGYAGHGGYSGRSGYSGHGGYYGHGHGHWGGGYWGGRWWPGVYYGPGFLWFLAALPLYCPVFWWDSVPYYYYNDAYYTWSPSAEGYVATDPPPAAIAPTNDAPADISGYDANAYDGSPPGSDPQAPIASGYPQNASSAPGSASVYAYPSNGQTAEQQASDRRECEQWAGSQAGGPGSADYRRAVIACFQGRGYSAQ